MANGMFTRELINYLDADNFFDSKRFFEEHPWNSTLEKNLLELKHKGYITTDGGDNRICDFDPTKKFLDLVKAIR